jgi:hypothetical protein
VSALDINKWDNTLRLDCTHDDGLGVIANLMEAVLPLNVALAETVTTETGKEHHATLICEDRGTQNVKDAIPRIKEVLTKRGFRNINIDPFLSPVRLPILKSCQHVVKQGWLRGVEFAQWIKEHHHPAKQNSVDLERAVVSADTENRLLRFVFPYRGAKTIKIPHSDRPGALRRIFHEFAGCHLNVLSALLRRGGQKSGYAELLAVCEPNPGDNPIEVYETLRHRITTLDQQFDAKLIVEDGLSSEDAIYLPRNPQQRPEPHAFCLAARCVKRTKRLERLVSAARQALNGLGCFTMEPRDGDSAAFTNTPPCKGTVLYLSGFRPDAPRGFEMNIAQELGFLNANNKPVLLLIDGVLNGGWDKLLLGPQFTIRSIVELDHNSLPDLAQGVQSHIAAWLMTLAKKR